MASRITHVNCPSCGGTLGTETGGRMVKCKYCGAFSLIDADRIVPQYFIEPLVKMDHARRSAQKLLSDHSLPDHLMAESRFEGAKLYMIPFYEMSGKRVGTIIQTTITEYQRLPQSRYNANHSQGIGSSTRSLREPATNVDTKVIMSDVFRSGPAVQIQDWGLSGVNYEYIRTEMQFALKPFRRSAVERYGQVFDPEVSVDDFTKGSIGSEMHMAEDHTRLAETKIKSVYYPIWRVKYRYQGRVYGITVDGVTAKVLAARAPARDSGRILWMFLSVGIVTLWGSKLIKALLGISASINEALSMMVGAGAYLLPFAILALGLLLTIVAFGWDQFRYSKEVVFVGENKMIESINRPPRTMLDKMRDGVFNLLEKMARQGKWNR